MTDNELQIKVAELCGWTDIGFGAHEMLVGSKQWGLYINRLFEAVSGASIKSQSLCQQVCHADARQRCEAFVRVMEDEK